MCGKCPGVCIQLYCSHEGAKRSSEDGTAEALLLELTVLKLNSAFDTCHAKNLNAISDPSLDPDNKFQARRPPKMWTQ